MKNFFGRPVYIYCLAYGWSDNYHRLDPKSTASNSLGLDASLYNVRKMPSSLYSSSNHHIEEDMQTTGKKLITRVLGMT